MHRRREKRREQRDAKVAAILDRLDAMPSLAPPNQSWEAPAQPPDAAENGTASVSLDWAALPALDPAADVLLKPERAQRKREQLQSLLHILRAHVLPNLPPSRPTVGQPQRRRRFVDFACGSGHFGLLVASQVRN